jgi:hypothetical protein
VEGPLCLVKVAAEHALLSAVGPGRRPRGPPARIASPSVLAPIHFIFADGKKKKKKKIAGKFAGKKKNRGFQILTWGRCGIPAPCMPSNW